MATKPQVRKTADELQVDYEIAADVLAEFFAFYAIQLAEARNAENPNLEEIEAIEKQIRDLKREKMSVGMENIELINKVLYVYAPLLKKQAALPCASSNQSK